MENLENKEIMSAVAGESKKESNTELDFKIRSPIEDTLYAVDFIIKNIEFYKAYVLEFKTIINHLNKENMCEEKYNSLLETMYKCKNSILSKDLETFTNTIEESRHLVKTLEMFFDLDMDIVDMTCYYQFTNNIFQCAINNIVGCFVYFYDYYEYAFKEEKEYCSIFIDGE